MQTMTHRKTQIAASLLAAAGISFLAAAAHAQTAAPGYSITSFGQAPAGATNPDSIAVSGGDVFIGYANTASKTGASGTSTIAEFSGAGTLLTTYTVSGHNDGLKVAPDGTLWSLQNEDGNPNLAIINTASGASQNYSLPSANGGGIDDVVFLNGKTYFSASNAQKDPNTDPAIVQATLTNGAFTYQTILAGNALANGGTTQLNLTDADSLTTTPDGSLFLTDQTANQVITVSNPGSPFQSVSAVATSYSGASTDVDDTLFTGGKGGTLLVSDTNSNTIYAISGAFAGSAFSAGPTDGIVGGLDLTTGDLSPIATGFAAPKGMAFLPAAVPEASTTVSFGLLLLLGFGGAALSARKKKNAA